MLCFFFSASSDFYIYSCCQSITLCGPGPATLLIWVCVCVLHAVYLLICHCHAVPCRAWYVCIAMAQHTKSQSTTAEAHSRKRKKQKKKTIDTLLPMLLPLLLGATTTAAAAIIHSVCARSRRSLLAVRGTYFRVFIFIRSYRGSLMLMLYILFVHKHIISNIVGYIMRADESFLKKLSFLLSVSYAKRAKIGASLSLSHRSATTAGERTRIFIAFVRITVHTHRLSLSFCRDQIVAWSIV